MEGERERNCDSAGCGRFYSRSRATPGSPRQHDPGVARGQRRRSVEPARLQSAAPLQTCKVKTCPSTTNGAILLSDARSLAPYDVLACHFQRIKRGIISCLIIRFNTRCETIILFVGTLLLPCISMIDAIKKGIGSS